MAGPEDEIPFTIDPFAPFQSRLKLFLANWLCSSHLVESCSQEGFFTGDADSTRRLHYTERIPMPTRSTTDPAEYDHSMLPFDNSGVKCVEVSIYTDKGFTAAKPRGEYRQTYKGCKELY
jgi:hypothetical protein